MLSVVRLRLRFEKGGLILVALERSFMNQSFCLQAKTCRSPQIILRNMVGATLEPLIGAQEDSEEDLSLGGRRSQKPRNDRNDKILWIKHQVDTRCMVRLLKWIGKFFFA